MLKSIRKSSVSSPSTLAVKSPQDYLVLITKVYPAWASKLPSPTVTNRTLFVCLAAAAVTMGNGSRINETLGLCVKHLMPNGCAVIMGSKGSNARVIYTGFSPEQVSQLQTLPGNVPLFPVCYKQVWHACVTNGLFVRELGHVNNSVTHAGRYAMAQRIANVAGESVAGQAIGHRSKNAIRNYTDTKTAQRERGKRIRLRHTPFGPNLEEFLTAEVFSA